MQRKDNSGERSWVHITAWCDRNMWLPCCIMVSATVQTLSRPNSATVLPLFRQYVKVPISVMKSAVI